MIDRSFLVWYENCSCWGTFHWLQVFWVKPFVTVPFLVIFRNMLSCILGSTYRDSQLGRSRGWNRSLQLLTLGAKMYSLPHKILEKAKPTLSQYFVYFILQYVWALYLNPSNRRVAFELQYIMFLKKREQSGMEIE